VYHSFEFGLQLKSILAGKEVLEERLVPQFQDDGGGFVWGVKGGAMIYGGIVIVRAILIDGLGVFFAGESGA